MTEEEKNYSKIMAEFVGYKKAGNLWHFDGIITPRWMPKDIFEGSNTNGFMFHNDYNWIHAVWVKFRDLNVGWKEFRYGTGNARKLTHYKQTIGEPILHDNISKVFTELGEAINWYNQNK